MNSIEALIAIIKDLKPFETIEIKMDEKGNIVYTYTKKERTVLTL
jgi:hypothetical protein